MSWLILMASIAIKKNDGMNYVDLTICDEEEFEGDLIPKILYLSAHQNKNDNIYIDYDMIEQPK